MNPKSPSQAFSPSQSYPVQTWQDGQPSLVHKHDVLAEEIPVALVYNGISHVVMLATPQDLEEFALGFSLTEGILRDKSELYGVEIVEQAQGIELHCEIANAQFANLKERRRNLLGRTGCGLCGAESIGQAMRVPSPRQLAPALHALSHAAIQHAFKSIQGGQVLQQATGATHACAWADVNGNVLLVREDVGRHNALDKLIGALAKAPPQVTGFVLTTSRASYEMVQKVASVGIHLLAAISAPTGLAVRFAEENGVTLVGFVRDNRHVIYAHPERINES
jgi:FdhD protein